MVSTASSRVGSKPDLVARRTSAGPGSLCALDRATVDLACARGRERAGGVPTDRRARPALDSAEGNPLSGQGEADSVYEKASEAVSDVTDRASDMWDEPYARGTRYYSGGSRALSNIDGGTWAAMFIADAIGYGLSLLIHG
jgi:hypothetical protein